MVCFAVFVSTKNFIIFFFLLTLAVPVYVDYSCHQCMVEGRQHLLNLEMAAMGAWHQCLSK